MPGDHGGCGWGQKHRRHPSGWLSIRPFALFLAGKTLASTEKTLGEPGAF